MKNLSYLKAFSLKSIRSARRIINHGITVQDIDEFLKSPEPYLGKPKPCKGCKGESGHT